MTDSLAELPTPLRDALARAAATERLLVAMDFDGTMAPLVLHADRARPLPAAASAFAALAALEGTTTALVSGRALSSLRAAASPPPQTLLVGSHGAEVWLGPGSAPLEPSDAQRLALARAVDAVGEVVRAHRGTHAELKPAGVVLHYRQATAEAGQAAVAQAQAALERIPGVYLSAGKKVLEASVVRADKGQSLRLLRAEARASAVVFAGDDVTDEHGFAALGPGDVGVKVGAGESCAPFRVAGPEQVPALLAALLLARR